MKVLKVFRGVFFFSVLYASIALGSPQITSLSDNKGPVVGGNSLTIYGTDLLGADAVIFGVQSVPQASFINNSSTQITLNVPGAPFGTVDIRVQKGADLSPIIPDAQYTYQSLTWFAYVTSNTSGSEAVFRLNIASNPINSTFTGTYVPHIVGTQPFGISITPDGYFAYPGSNAAQPTPINKIDTFANAIVATVKTFAGPFYTAISPNGKTVYTEQSSLDAIQSIDVATTQNTGVTLLNSSGSPIDVAVLPNGKYVYASSTAPLFSVLNTTNGSFTNVPFLFYPGGNTYSLAVSPNGKFVYLPDVTLNGVHVVDTSTNSEVNVFIPTGVAPISIAITPNGQFGFVTSSGTNTVTQFDLNTNLVVHTISSSPLFPSSLFSGIAITPDGKTAYVLDKANNQILFLDIASAAFGSTAISLAPFPGTDLTGIAISPDQAPVASFTTSAVVKGAPITFDASRSVSPVGSITHYIWNFGDGSPQEDVATPSITHTYTTGGSMVVTLTVTNDAGTSTTQVFTGHTVSNQGSSRAQYTKTLLIPGAPSALTHAPRNFRGKIFDNGDSRFLLKMRWTASSSPNVAAYEIFAHNKRIASISPKAELLFSVATKNFYIGKQSGAKTRVVVPLNTRSYYKENQHKYKNYLEKKYKIRAVFSTGFVSDFVFLEIE